MPADDHEVHVHGLDQDAGPAATHEQAARRDTVGKGLDTPGVSRGGSPHAGSRGGVAGACYTMSPEVRLEQDIAGMDERDAQESLDEMVYGALYSLRDRLPPGQECVGSWAFWVGSLPRMEVVRFVVNPGERVDEALVAATVLYEAQLRETADGGCPSSLLGRKLGCPRATMGGGPAAINGIQAAPSQASESRWARGRGGPCQGPSGCGPPCVCDYRACSGVPRLPQGVPRRDFCGNRGRGLGRGPAPT